jgi:hypothetical protein
MELLFHIAEQEGFADERYSMLLIIVLKNVTRFDSIPKRALPESLPEPGVFYWKPIPPTSGCSLPWKLLTAFPQFGLPWKPLLVLPEPQNTVKHSSLFASPEVNNPAICMAAHT